jgi:hypothetical protein
MITIVEVKTKKSPSSNTHPGSVMVEQLRNTHPSSLSVEQRRNTHPSSLSVEQQRKYNQLVVKAKKLATDGNIKEALVYNKQALSICFSDKLQKRIQKMEVILYYVSSGQCFAFFLLNTILCCIFWTAFCFLSFGQRFALYILDSILLSFFFFGQQYAFYLLNSTRKYCIKTKTKSIDFLSYQHMTFISVMFKK